jgi:glutathionyl-hydroquinone reductase
MVKQPIISWDGNYSTKNNDETSTRINPLMLIDKIEEIIKEIRKRLNEGILKCEFDVEELKTRFTIIKS